MSAYTVSEVAKLAHVTVRTLHHYDEIGLLIPSDRSRKGYRLYSDADLARLREILLFRELGFALDAIAELLEQGPAERKAALAQQRERLVAQRAHTDAVIRAVDTVLDAIDGGRPMTTETMFEGFEEFDHAKYEDEARERWGDTEAFQESARRTKRYGKAEWDAIKAEGGEILAGFAAAMAAGKRPRDPEVQAIVERHRLHIDRWFYPCTKEMHANVARMYTQDPRFEAFYEKVAKGLAAFVSEAVVAAAE